MDDNFQFSQMTPERIVADYLVNMQEGDFGILDEVKSAIHQQIAYELIKAGEAKLLANNLSKFKNINQQQIVEALIDAGENFLADQCSGYFSEVDFDKIGKQIDKL